MALSDSLLALARRMTLLYGQSCTFSRVVEGTFVPSTGAVGAGTTTSYTANMVRSTFTKMEVNHTTIMQDDVVGYLELNTAGYVPYVGDVATISGEAYRILKVEATSLQGDSLLYKLQMRV